MMYTNLNMYRTDPYYPDRQICAASVDQDQKAESFKGLLCLPSYLIAVIKPINRPFWILGLKYGK